MLEQKVVIGLSLLVCIVGLLIYALAEKAKVVEIGRIMFFWGLGATLLAAKA